MSWTDERIALLKKMWKDGKSAAEIAKALAKGVTRNAVIGKAHRMGLSGRPSPIKKPVVAPKKEAPKKEVKVPPKKPVVPVVTGVKHNPLLREVAPPRQMAKEVFPEDGGVALIDLTERMCKWPFGDPREDDFTFCGRPIRTGTPYCPDHAAQAYQSSSRSRAPTPHEEKVVEETADDDEAEVVT
jgi:GcrA cell cycle regulator